MTRQIPDSQKWKSANTLKQLLETYFDLPVKVLRGNWTSSPSTVIAHAVLQGGHRINILYEDVSFFKNNPRRFHRSIDVMIEAKSENNKVKAEIYGPFSTRKISVEV